MNIRIIMLYLQDILIFIIIGNPKTNVEADMAK